MDSMVRLYIRIPSFQFCWMPDVLVDALANVIPRVLHGGIENMSHAFIRSHNNVRSALSQSHKRLTQQITTWRLPLYSCGGWQEL